MNYREWFNIADITRKHQYGTKYFSGVERAAALAACEAQDKGKDAAIDAMCETFDRFVDRCPKWDGNIA